jgi:heme-degrading monooxygenase HmoA
MAVYSIWESYFPPVAAAEGRMVTERIWADMTGFGGYLGHELLQDLDDSGHLLVVSRWSSQVDADDALAEYTEHPNALQVNRLVDRPRRRLLAVKLPHG